MLILTSLGPFGEGWYLSISGHSHKPDLVIHMQWARLCTICKCDERIDTWHIQCMSLKPHWKHAVLSTLWERWNSGTTVWGAVCKEVTEPSVPIWQLCSHTSLVPALLYAVPFSCKTKESEGERHFCCQYGHSGGSGVIKDSFSCLQRPRYKYSRFH